MNASKIITAKPGQNEFDGLGFFWIVGTALDVIDLCEFEGVESDDVQGLDSVVSDLTQQYEEGALLRLDIVDAN